MATIYVSASTGSNNNSGETTSAPKKTITAGIQKARAGDTVAIMAGVYKEAVTINKANLTVTNYSGQSVTISGDNYSLPYTGSKETAPLRHPADPDMYASWVGLVNITGSGVTLSNVTVEYSNGRGIVVQAAAGQKDPTTGVTVSGVTVQHTRNQCMHFNKATACTVSNCRFEDIRNFVLISNGSVSQGNVKATYADSRPRTTNQNGVITGWLKGETVFVNWPASINCSSSEPMRDMLIEDCHFEELYCAGLAMNGTGGDMAGTVVRDCVFTSLTNEAIDIHAEDDFLYERITFYGVSDPKHSRLRGGGFYIQASEDNFNLQAAVRNGIIRNCLFVNCDSAISFSGDKESKGSDNVVIANNTIIGHADTAFVFRWGQETANDIQIKNNIFYHIGTGSGFLLSKGKSAATAQDWDNNYWRVAPPTYVRGANDIYGGSMGLVNPTAAVRRNRPPQPANYKLDSGSALIGQGEALAEVPADFFGSTRDASTPDIGFHERTTGEPTLSVDFTPVNASTDVDTAVSFNATASVANGASAERWVWDFGDGGGSSLEDPTHTFVTPGVYTVSVTAYDDTNSLVANKTYEDAYIISPVGSAAPAGYEVVDLQAGDNLTVSSTPKLVLFFASGASADDTPTADAQFSFGVWTPSGSYAWGVKTKDGVTTTDTNNGRSTGRVVQFVDDTGQAALYAEPGSATSSSLPLTWTGTDNNERVTALVFYGNAVSDVNIGEFSLASASYTIPTSCNVVITPSSLYSSFGNGIASMMIGLAVNRSGTTSQAATSWTSRGAVATGEPYSGVHADRVWSWDRNTARGHIEWSGNTATIYNDVTDTRVGHFVSFTMDLDLVDVYVGTGTLPASTGANDYSLPFTPGALLMLVNGSTTVGQRESSNAAAGPFTVYVTDGTSERSIAVATDYGASPTEENSITADELLIVNDDGSDYNVGAVTLGASKFTVNLTTAGGAARAFAYLALESVAGGSGPQAAWSYSTDYGIVQALGNVYLWDASDATGGAISAWSWKVNGEEVGTTQNYTWVPDSSGTYNVSLTVTNAGGSSTSSKTITVYPPVGTMTGWAFPARDSYLQRTYESPSDSDPIEHSVFSIIDVPITTLPDAAQVIEIVMRQEDADNYWKVQITDAGTVNLIKVVATTPTTVATSAGGAPAGKTLRIVNAGTHIATYLDSSASASTEEATEFQSSVDGEVLIGTGAAIGDISVYGAEGYAVVDGDVELGMIMSDELDAIANRYVWQVADYNTYGSGFGDPPLSEWENTTYSNSATLVQQMPESGFFGAQPGLEILTDSGPEVVWSSFVVPISALINASSSFIDENFGGTRVGPYLAKFRAEYYRGAEYIWEPESGVFDYTSGHELDYLYEDNGTYSPALTVRIPYGAEKEYTTTLTDYITVAGVASAPLDNNELDDVFDNLVAHLGVLTDVTWTRESSPNANVWSIALSDHSWADGMTVRVVEDGITLTAQASVAAAQAAAGSSYYTYSSGTLTIYVHPTGSDSPNANNKTYRWID